MDVEHNVVPIDDSQNIVLGKVEPIKTEPLETVQVGKAQRLDIPVTSIAQFSQLQAGKMLHLYSWLMAIFPSRRAKADYRQKTGAISTLPRSRRSSNTHRRI
jgi:hypothetical protein